MIKHPTDEKCGKAGFRCPAQTRVPARCKRGRWARSRQALLVVYVPQQHSEVPDTILLLLLYHVSYNKIEATKKCGASRYDLQQQRSRIMMHPSYHRAARRQRRSHAPILSRQPRSVRTSIWSMSRACYVRACCVLSLCVMRVDNLSSYDHFVRQIIFHRESVRD